MKYPINQRLLEKAHRVLHDRKNLYWIIGGSCVGKSTVCKALSEKYGITVYDMDEYIFDKYQQRYTDELHPANRAWFTAPNPLEWSFSHGSWEENNEFNIAAAVEYLDLLCQDIEKLDKEKPVLLDEGVTNPAVVARVISPKQILCLKADSDACRRIWEEAEERQPMKEMIMRLPNPQDKWNRFLDINDLMNEQVEKECRENDIKILLRKDNTAVEDLVIKIARYFKWQ